MLAIASAVLTIARTSSGDSRTGIPTGGGGRDVNRNHRVNADASMSITTGPSAHFPGPGPFSLFTCKTP